VLIPHHKLQVFLNVPAETELDKDSEGDVRVSFEESYMAPSDAIVIFQSLQLRSLKVWFTYLKPILLLIIRALNIFDNLPTLAAPWATN